MVTTPDNGAAIDGAAVVVLAVKPQVVAAVLRSLGPHWPRSSPLLLSIVAGVRIDDLAQLCPSLPIVRAMPNRPALVGAGVTALFAAPTVPVALRPLAEQVAAAAGRFLWLRAESELDIATALSGSGPAYFFLLAEQLAQAAIALGLEPATATLLATETLHGSGVLAHLGSLARAARRGYVQGRHHRGGAGIAPCRRIRRSDTRRTARRRGTQRRAGRPGRKEPV